MPVEAPVERISCATLLYHTIVVLNTAVIPYSPTRVRRPARPLSPPFLLFFFHFHFLLSAAFIAVDLHIFYRFCQVMRAALLLLAVCRCTAAVVCTYIIRALRRLLLYTTIILAL